MYLVNSQRQGETLVDCFGKKHTFYKQHYTLVEETKDQTATIT